MSRFVYVSRTRSVRFVGLALLACSGEDPSSPSDTGNEACVANTTRSCPCGTSAGSETCFASTDGQTYWGQCQCQGQLQGQGGTSDANSIVQGGQGGAQQQVDPGGAGGLSAAGSDTAGGESSTGGSAETAGAGGSTETPKIQCPAAYQCVDSGLELVPQSGVTMQYCADPANVVLGVVLPPACAAPGQNDDCVTAGLSGANCQSLMLASACVQPCQVLP